jgi:hypothetical protein
MSPTPIRVGDMVRDAEDVARPPTVSPEFCTHLCTNCFHSIVCNVALAVRVALPTGVEIAVGSCNAHMPIEDLGPESLAQP